MLGWVELGCCLQILRRVEVVPDVGQVWTERAERVFSVVRAAVRLERSRAGWRRGGESSRD